MLLNQHEKRKSLMSMLYLSEFYERDELPGQLELFIDYQLFAEAEDAGKGDPEFFPPDFDEEKKQLLERFAKIQEKIGIIDPMVASVSHGWKLGRMSKTDLAILRLGVFEMFFDDEVPSPVAIDEAVKLAEVYGSDSSSKSFINGILGQLERNRMA